MRREPRTSTVAFAAAGFFVSDGTLYVRIRYRNYRRRRFRVVIYARRRCRRLWSLSSSCASSPRPRHMSDVRQSFRCRSVIATRAVVVTRASVAVIVMDTDARPRGLGVVEEATTFSTARQVTF